MTGFETKDEERYYERIDINTASPSELLTLPGIDSTKADLIFRARPYVRLSDLEGVDGIDHSTVNEIRRFTTTGVTTLSLLRISAIDLLYLSTVPPVGEETEIEQRIKYFVRAEYGLTHETPVNIDDLSRSSGFEYGISEAIEMGRQILDTLGTGSVLQPGSLCLPAEADGAAYSLDNVSELWERINKDILPELCEVIVLLGGEPIKDLKGDPLCRTLMEEITKKKLIGALFKASLYGISGAIPASPYESDSDLDTKREKVLAELNKRATDCMKLQEKADRKLKKEKELWHEAENETDDIRKTELLARAGEAYEKSITALASATKTLLGRDFHVLPFFNPHRLDNLKSAFGHEKLLAGLGEERVRLWLQQAAYVHPPLRQLEDALIMTEAWRQASDGAGEPAIRLQVAQLPYNPANRWLALDDDERGSRINVDITTGRGALSIIAAVAGQQTMPVPDPTTSTGVAPFAGLLLHQWDELIPSDKVDTSVSFQYDGPNSQAPQCLLLAVPSQRSKTPKVWQVDELAEIVRDTMDLAKVRLVDLDAMREIEGDTSGEQGVGLVFPSLMFPTDPYNPGWARNAFADSIQDWVDALLHLQRDVFLDFAGFELFQPVGSNVVHSESGIEFTEMGSGQLHIGGYWHQVSLSEWDWKKVLVSNKAGIRIELPEPVPRVDVVAGWLDPSDHEVVVMDENGNPLDAEDHFVTGYTRQVRLSEDGEEGEYHFWTHHVSASGIKSAEIRGRSLLSIFVTFKEV
jgi:hypothetical protein